MAKGRGSAMNHFLVALVVLFVVQCSLVEVQGATYVVGGPQGWGLQIQKSRWTTGKRFKAGDVLVFKYTPGAHNVVSVNSAGYKSCTKGASPSLTSGNDKVTLKKGGNYFICSFTGHCTSGMKIAVTAA
ncbi:hypothetical protein SUGI_0673560 [Cryptomeria japonica]|uniref:basic blue protein n=1 Tax=Cryptomeria japonica TaxID=3369 RepID=UPI002414C605|nr:basic blue protein [Cryptomeria japonica]GLJ33480.1 hypothetical protein SUGI_0673560 [Cryptomeria japonica]